MTNDQNVVYAKAYKKFLKKGFTKLQADAFARHEVAAKA